MRCFSILWCVAVGWGPASILAQFDFDGIPESFAPTITFAPTPSPTKAPTASPTTSPPSLSPTNPPTLPPTLSASDAPAAAGATRKPTPTPTERPTPTDAPTPTEPPTDAGGYDKRSSYNVPLWFEFAAAIGFALLVCVPCTACFVHVCVYRKKFPDFGAMGATPWYDDRRGQTYGVILFCTIVNFIALFAALMAGDDDPEVVKDFNLAVVQASSGEIRVGAAAASRVVSSDRHGNGNRRPQRLRPQKTGGRGRLLRLGRVAPERGDDVLRLPVARRAAKG